MKERRDWLGCVFTVSKTMKKNRASFLYVISHPKIIECPVSKLRSFGVEYLYMGTLVGSLADVNQINVECY